MRVLVDIGVGLWIGADFAIIHMRLRTRTGPVSMLD
jgi:hypothetical protein